MQLNALALFLQDVDLTDDAVDAGVCVCTVQVCVCVHCSGVCVRACECVCVLVCVCVCVCVWMQVCGGEGLEAWYCPSSMKHKHKGLTVLFFLTSPFLLTSIQHTLCYLKAAPTKKHTTPHPCHTHTVR